MARPRWARASLRESGEPSSIARARARLQDADLLERVLHVGQRLVHERLQAVGAADVEEPAGVHVGVDVGDRLGPQLPEVRLDPFRRAEQALLFAVPCRVDEGAPRPEAASRQLAHGPRLLEQRDQAAHRVAPLR